MKFVPQTLGSEPRVGLSLGNLALPQNPRRHKLTKPEQGSLQSMAYFVIH